MDIEFHYYLTYYIARSAGFNADQAQIISYASQYVDDNNENYAINRGRTGAFKNEISQKLDAKVLCNWDDKDRYALFSHFHFIPSEDAPQFTNRHDKEHHILNTLPNSGNANKMMRNAIASKDLYRLGIASHCYVDTWAHQNFIGILDPFNELDDDKNSKTIWVPNLGHADAFHKPDIPNLIWKDKRLKQPVIDNKARFLEAAKHLYEAYSHYNGISQTKEHLKHMVEQISDAIGTETSHTSVAKQGKQVRIKKYKQMIRFEFGDKIPHYKERSWKKKTIRTKKKFYQTHAQHSWRHLDKYQQSHWYQFQQAVKAHIDDMQAILAYINIDDIVLKDAA